MSLSSFFQKPLHQTEKVLTVYLNTTALWFFFHNTQPCGFAFKRIGVSYLLLPKQEKQHLVSVNLYTTKDLDKQKIGRMSDGLNGPTHG